MRGLFFMALVILQLVALATGNIPLFMGTFIVGAVASAKYAKKSQYAYACVTSCALTAISYDTSCSIRGGMKTVYWARYSDIDWTLMTSNIDNAGPTIVSFDSVTKQFKKWYMVSGKKFAKLSFERKQGFYNFTFTEDTDVYTQIITMIFEGKSNANKNAFASAIGCCDIIAIIVDNNCLSRVVGVEYNGSTFEKQLKALKITRHLDASGQFGTDKARDEIDLGGESLTGPSYSLIAEADIPV